VLLAGDIGGTKALLALVDAGAVRFERRYRCGDFGTFGALLERFRADAREALGAPPRIDRASLGVAGPVSDGSVRLTHRAWQIDAATLGFGDVRLLNDFEASAYGIDGLAADDLATLQAGAPRAGAPRLLIGAGTGLGVAIVTAGGVIAGEGGHAAFAPASHASTRSCATAAATSRAPQRARRWRRAIPRPRSRAPRSKRAIRSRSQRSTCSSPATARRLAITRSRCSRAAAST